MPLPRQAVRDPIDARINFLGASGSGTSTSARAVANALSIPYFDCDDYYHAESEPPFQNPREPQARHDLIARDLRPDCSWVLAGGVAGWEPLPELGFTLVVFLWVPTEVRLARLREREQARFGARIEEGGDMFHAHRAFLEWAGCYDVGDMEGKTLARHEQYLLAQDGPVLDLRGRRSTGEVVEEVLTAVQDAV